MCSHPWKGDVCLPLCHDGPQETMVGQAQPLLSSLKPQSRASLSICPALASGMFPELFLLPPELQPPGPIPYLASVALRAFPAWDSTQPSTSSARDPKFRPYHTPTAFAECPLHPLISMWPITLVWKDFHTLLFGGSPFLIPPLLQ